MLELNTFLAIQTKTLSRYWSDKSLKGTVVNQACPSLHYRSLKSTSKFPSYLSFSWINIKTKKIKMFEWNWVRMGGCKMEAGHYGHFKQHLYQI